jgi:hypothetical protein
METSCSSTRDGLYSIMRKRWLLSLGLALAVALLAGFWLIMGSQWLPTEPVYQGKPLSFWLPRAIMFNTGGVRYNPDNYRDALAAAGPRAIPFILGKLRKSDSSLAKILRALWPRLPPALKRMIPMPRNPRADHDYPSRDAAAALMCLGTNAIPSLVDAIDDSNPSVREAAAEALCGFAGGSLSTNDTARIFGKAIEDKDAGVRMFAAFALARIGPAASNSVPALIRALDSPQSGHVPGEMFFVHGSAASALAAIGRPAMPAIPVLTRLLPAADHSTQCILTNALRVLELQTAGRGTIE